MEEQALLSLARGGDKAAFAKLMEQYEKRVYHQALRMVNSPEDAADVTQEAFFKAWRGLPAFRGECSFSTYLYRLADNAAIDLLRREKKRRGDVPLDEAGCGWDRYLTDPGPTPEQALAQRELEREAARALARLPVEQREILVLREINGASYEEIGAILGVPIGTVRSRLARARLALREAMAAGER